jgi:outer membrane protein assembly factor BamB
MFLIPKIKLSFFASLLFISLVTPCKSQTGIEQVTIDTLTYGVSAVSVNEIQATALRFEYPVRDYVFDTISNLFFVSGKQQGDLSDQVLVKGFFAAVNQSNKVKWIVESSLYDLEFGGGQLIVSNEERSVKFNKQAGYDELNLSGRVVLTFNNAGLGFVYKSRYGEELDCVDLKTGTRIWTTMLPGGQDWVDHQQINDSLVFIAASGLHAIHLKKGLLWSIPFSTAISTAKALTYSLAKHSTIQNISHVIHTAVEENLVTQLASNILVNNGNVILASKDQCTALNFQGQELWHLDLKNYPISKMLLIKTETTILLVNFGLAMHSDRFVSWGKPFILELDPNNGNILHQHDLSIINNLADFVQSGNSFVFAGKDEVLSVATGATVLKSMLSISPGTYGRFIEFVDGNEHYTFKEGYCVPLNFINGNLIYFKTDNNKIYGVDGDYIQYEYHFTELFRLLGKFDNKKLLTNGKKTILISENYELLYELYTAAPVLISKEKIYFIEENRVVILGKENLR